jgi:hypothetical protein
MRVLTGFGGAALTAATVLGSVGVAAPAQAAFEESALSGTYEVLSDGEFAKTNDVFFDEQTETQTWTASTTCISPIECTGSVTSSQGWTGTARLDAFWYVERDIPNWAPCPDGTFATGRQMFILTMWDRMTEEQTYDPSFLQGRNVTKTASGSCGKNQPLVIELPVSVRRVS